MNLLIHTDNEDIRSLVNNFAASAQEKFNDRCMAIYLMGSLARGGFSERASDIDVGVILAGPLREADQADIDSSVLAITNSYPQIENNLSVFWGSVDSINGVVDAGRYPPFDRLDLIEHGALLQGEDIRDRLLKPGKQELEIAGAEFALDYLGHPARIDEFIDCARFASKDAVYITKTILFPARFLYLEHTGKVAGNDVSCQYYLNNFQGSDAELIEQGYQWRLHSLPGDTGLVIDWLSQGLVKLYCNFIDIYAERMAAYGEYKLEARLLAWKQAISA